MKLSTVKDPFTFKKHLAIRKAQKKFETKRKKVSMLLDQAEKRRMSDDIHRSLHLPPA